MGKQGMDGWNNPDAPGRGGWGCRPPPSIDLCPGAPRNTWGTPGLVGIYGAWDSFVQLSGPVPPVPKTSVILNGGVTWPVTPPEVVVGVHFLSLATLPLCVAPSLPGPGEEVRIQAPAGVAKHQAPGQ